MEAVAGGYYYYMYDPTDEEEGRYRVDDRCYNDFTDLNCWFSDACEKRNVNYYDCDGSYH